MHVFKLILNPNGNIELIFLLYLTLQSDRLLAWVAFWCVEFQELNFLHFEVYWDVLFYSLEVSWLYCPGLFVKFKSWMYLLELWKSSFRFTLYDNIWFEYLKEKKMLFS